MADPLMQTTCCQLPKFDDRLFQVILELDSDTYNYVCLLSSAIGIAGAIYQILPRVGSAYPHHWYWMTSRRGRQIIIWLALADLLASFGVFVRSIFKLASPMMAYFRPNSLQCILLAYWIQYFYVVSWLWTLVYAIDTWLALREQTGYRHLYHALCWLLPAASSTFSFFAWYMHDVSCYISYESGFWRIIPNYLFVYLPMITVMIMNPVFYIMSAYSMHSIVAQYLSQYTKKERHVVDLIRIKFGLINVTFYMCWMPNLINTILLITMWDCLPQKTLLSISYIMAIMNPLQALFNSLVYKRPQDQIVLPWNKRKKPDSQLWYGETTPLLAVSRGSSNNSDHQFEYTL